MGKQNWVNKLVLWCQDITLHSKRAPNSYPTLIFFWHSLLLNFIVRTITLAVVQVKFHIKDMIFRIHDVGGQRSERRKWLYLFDCVHAVCAKIIMKMTLSWLVCFQPGVSRIVL